MQMTPKKAKSFISILILMAKVNDTLTSHEKHFFCTVSKKMGIFLQTL